MRPGWDRTRDPWICSQTRKMTNADHHIGRPPFLNTNLGVDAQFPIDYMHPVCLGL